MMFVPYMGHLVISMDPNNKEGVTVKEMGEFARKYRIELVFCLSFLFACFFSFVFFGPGWAVLFASAGGIIGALAPAKVEFFSKKVYTFCFKQEATTQMVLGVVHLIVAIVLPPLIFLKLGLHGGKSLRHIAEEISGSRR